MTGTLGREVISTRQRKIAELARREPKPTLTTLAHHIDSVWMCEAYRRTRKDAAAGVDGVTAANYEADLEANLSGLLERFKSERYETERLWRKWLGRRSWRGRMTWERFARLHNTYPLPPARIAHSVYR